MEILELHRLIESSVNPEIIKLGEKFAAEGRKQLQKQLQIFLPSLRPTLKDLEFIRSSFIKILEVANEINERKFAIAKRAVKSKLPEEISADIDKLTPDQFRYYKMGFESAETYCIKIIYAQFKFIPRDFAAVDRLILRKRYSQKGALDEIATKKGFNRESFEKQYRVRHLNKKVKRKGSSPKDQK